MKNFVPQEFIPKKTYDYFQSEYGNGDLGMRYININIPKFLDFLRDYFNAPISLNNYHKGGSLDGCVLRLSDDPAYKQYSDHSMGNAADIHIPSMDNKEVYNALLYTIPETLKSFNVSSMECIDMTPTWIHIGFSDFSYWTIEKINDINIIRPKN